MTTLRTSFSLTTALLVALNPLAAFAHTTLETSSMSEGVRVVNNAQIGHACGTNTSVIGTSVVFPDGVDSTLLVNGLPYSGLLSDFISNWGPNIQPMISRAVFTTVDKKLSPTGKTVGFWAGGGAGMPDNMVGYIPFRVNATNFNPASCATSVKFRVSIVDACVITTADHLHDDGVAHFWTSNTLKTVYDSPTADDAANLTINRNLTTNPLPPACGGTGIAVEVRATAAQLNRDMPIRINGVQIWPKP